MVIRDHDGKLRPAPSPLSLGWAGNSELWSSRSFIQDFGGQGFYLYFLFLPEDCDFGKRLSGFH